MHAGHEKHGPILGGGAKRGVTDKSMPRQSVTLVTSRTAFLFILPGVYSCDQASIFVSAHLGAQGHAGHGVLGHCGPLCPFSHLRISGHRGMQGICFLVVRTTGLNLITHRLT